MMAINKTQMNGTGAFTVRTPKDTGRRRAGACTCVFTRMVKEKNKDHVLAWLVYVSRHALVTLLPSG